MKRPSRHSMQTRLNLAIALACGLFFSFAAAAGPVPVAAEPTAEDGRKLWTIKKNKCLKCHGENGKAQTKMGKKKKIPDMSTAEWQKRFSDKEIMEAVLKGIDRMDDKRKVKMKPLKGATERDAKALLKYVRSFKGK